ncbi:MAG: hypothetical protein AAF797_07065 [Planctomycetota bacterium]
MHTPDHHYYLNAIPPAEIKDDAAFVSNVIDLGTVQAAGADRLVFFVQLGSIDADLSVLKLVESDTLTNATTLGGTPADVLDALDQLTAAPGAADDSKLIRVELDLGSPRKRYVQLQATAGNGAAGTYLSALAVLTHVNTPTAGNGASFTVST